MIYVMSDIHGNDVRFRSVMKQIKLKPEDHLYILGDVVDRFPDGLGILRETMKAKNITLLLGNHEYMMWNAITHPEDEDARLNWFWNGGGITYTSFKYCNKKYKKEVLDYIAQLPVNVEINVNGRDYILTHAAPEDMYGAYKNQYKNKILFAVWHRLRRHDYLPEGKTVIFGHTPTYEYSFQWPMRVWYGQNRIGIDCGCADLQTGRLGCLRLDDMKEFYSEEAFDEEYARESWTEE